MEAILDDLGRITLPKQLRDRLGLAGGAVLRIEEHENQIVLTPVADEHLAVEDGVLVFTGALGDSENESAVLIGRFVDKIRADRDLLTTGLPWDSES